MNHADITPKSNAKLFYRKLCLLILLQRKYPIWQIFMHVLGHGQEEF